MKTFLELLAEEISKSYSENLADICIVTPTKRSQRLLVNELHKHSGETLMLPEFLTIDELMLDLSGLQKIDNLQLLLMLNKIFRDSIPEQDEFDEKNDFKKFVGWATLFLNDINEIDLHLKNGEAAFSSLTSIRELSMYDIPENQLTDLQKNYLNFFKKLEFFYKDIREKLLDQNLAYQGLYYRQAVGSFNPNKVKNRWEKLLFCGFNALTESELHIMKQLKVEGLADFYWDIDKDLLKKNSEDKTGIFIRKNLEFLGIDNDTTFVAEHFLSDKNIEIIEAPSDLAQAKYAASIFHKIVSKNKEQNTVLIPVDETVLPLLLNSIPEDVNITMGLSLSNLMPAKFVGLLFDLHTNSQRHSEGKKEALYYYKDLIAILSHPYIQKLFKDNLDYNNNVVATILSKNISYYTQKGVENLIENQAIWEAIGELFNRYENAVDFLRLILKVLNSIEDLYPNIENKSSVSTILKSFIVVFEDIFKDIISALESYKINLKIDELSQIFFSKLSSQTLSFSGDAHQGPQLMGFLETRLLDFNNVIMLSVNESVLPAGKTHNSLLPFDLRRHLGLYSHIQKDAVFAYHFYRLLYRAKNISLLYLGSSADGKAEKSRFIRQLEYDISKRYPNIKITSKVLDFDYESSQNNEIIIKKTDEVFNKLKSINYISPSAISTYIQCPLKYYFRYVEKIKEADEIMEDPDYALLGTIIHEVLEDIYGTFTPNVVLVANDFKQFNHDKIKELSIKAFEKNKFTKEDLQSGRNAIACEVVQKYVSDYLNYQIELIGENVEIIPIAQEVKLKHGISVDAVEDSVVYLTGIADSIEKIDGVVNVIDYKTGSVDDKEVMVLDIQELFYNLEITSKKSGGPSSKAKALQLMCYALAFMKDDNLLAYNKDLKLLSSKIASLRKKDPYFDLKIGIDVDSNVIDLDTLNIFEKELSEFLNTHIYNKDLAFTQTEDVKNCEYCPYDMICNRN